ncbi:MAG: RimK family alpha-L-glutamate ligase, partial [Pseudomonas graminis]
MNAVPVKTDEVSAQPQRSATLNVNPLKPVSTRSQLLIVVERLEDWSSYLPSEHLISAQDYLENP